MEFSFSKIRDLKSSAKILMLAPHDPDLDPRVEWMVNSLREFFSLTLWGTVGPRNPQPGSRVSHNLIKVIYKTQSVSRVTAFLMKELLLHAYRKNRVLGALFAVLGLLVLPVLLIVEFCLNIFKTLVWRPIATTFSFRAIGLIVRAWGNRLSGDTNAGLDMFGIKRLLWYLMHFIRINGTFLELAKDELNAHYDVIHCNDLDSLPAGYLLKKIYFPNASLIYDAHELWPESDVNANVLQRWMFGKLESYLIKKCDLVITVNPILAKEFEKKYQIQDVISLPNASPFNFKEAAEPFVPSQERLAEADVLPKNSVKFLFQGNFSPGRGLKTVIRNFAKLQDTSILLMRGPDNPFKMECIRLARDLGVLEKKIFFLPPVKETQLIDAARFADVGVIPYEPICINNKLACPNKLSQYLQAGLPVFSNNLDYVQQILEESNAGTSCDFNDATGFAASIAHLLKPDTRAAYSTNAKLYARDEFNWEKQIQPLLERYCQLV